MRCRREGFETKLDIADDRVVKPLSDGAVVEDIVRGPQLAELVALGDHHDPQFVKIDIDVVGVLCSAMTQIAAGGIDLPRIGLFCNRIETVWANRRRKALSRLVSGGHRTKLSCRMRQDCHDKHTSVTEHLMHQGGSRRGGHGLRPVGHELGCEASILAKLERTTAEQHG